MLSLLRRHRAEIQARIGKHIALKYTPRLSFELDTSLERGDRVLQVLSEMEEEVVVVLVAFLEKEERALVVVDADDRACGRGEQLLEQLNNGADFVLLAVQYSIDPSTRPDGGDLGWFPQGYLLIPEVEATAFRLQPGEISDIVESELGFHIVQTLDREVRQLSPDARSALRHSIVEEWLITQRKEADIQILISP